MLSKRQRRLRKRAEREAAANDAGVPALAETGRRKPSGQIARAEEAADKLALANRARDYGQDATKAVRQSMRDQMAGFPEGMCILRRVPQPEERSRLWKAWTGYIAAHRAYRMRYGPVEGRDSIPHVPTPTETLERRTPDTRTEEERDRAVVSTWMAWQGHLGHLGAADASVLTRHAEGMGRPLWQDGAPTETGRLFVTMLARLADVVERG